jgi:WD40 repeat protein
VNVIFSRKRGVHLCEDCDHEFALGTPFAARRVFLSYGHDEHASLVERLRDDLKARGHGVWFDVERLDPGLDWEQRIEAGLEWLAADKQSSAVILLLTPHAVRRPGGYCLNEVARALSRRLRIIPLMVVESEPPLSICRIQWLDMRECIPIHEKEAFYRPRFERLLKALEEGQIDFEGTQHRLLKALHPLEFDADILGHVPKFIGRQWVFEAIREWLAAPPLQRVFWICGSPGVGKTAISAILSSRYLEVAALHLCKFGHAQKSDPRRVVTSLAYQLTTQLPDYEARLAAMDVERLAMDDARTMFDNLLVQPLARINPPNRPIVILIDALDEATSDGRNDLASFIASEFPRTPSWLRLIITSRPEKAVTAPLQGLNPFILDTEREENLADLRTYLERELAALLQGRADTDSIVAGILERSEGVFLYAERVCSDIRVGNLSLDRIDAFPRGLGEVFWQFFARQFPDLNGYKDRVRDPLMAVTAAREPLPLSYLQRLFSWREVELRDFVRSLGSLFPVVSKGGVEVIQPYHRALTDWLTDESKAADYYASLADGHSILADAGWNEYLGGPSSMSSYSLRHLAAHLVGAERWEDVCTLICDLRFVEARCRVGEMFELQADYQMALENLPEAQEGIRERREREERIARWTREIIAYARAWSERRDRQARGESIAVGEPLLPEAPETCRMLPDEEIEKECGRIVTNPTRLDRLNCFASFVGAECYSLLEFGQRDGFVVQQAFNFQPLGPVHNAAAELVYDLETTLLLRRWPCAGTCDQPSTLPRTIRGHGHRVTDVSVTSNGRRAVSVSWDKTLRVWDLENGRCLHTLKGHFDRINAVSITPDGSRAVTGGSDTILRVWDLEAGRCVRHLMEHSEVMAVSLTPDGSRAVSGGGGNTVRVWDLEAGSCLHTLEGHSDCVMSVCLTPDGRTAVSGSSDNTLRVWDLESGICLRTLEGHFDGVCTVDITPDGCRAVSGSGDNRVRVWDLESGVCVQTLEGHSKSVTTLSLTPDGRLAISGSLDRTLRAWDLQNGFCLHAFLGSDRVLSVGCTPDGCRAVSADFDHNVRVWDLETGHSWKSMKGHTDMVRGVSALEDQSRAVTASGDETLKIWDLQTGCCVKTLQGHSGPVSAVCRTADGQRVVSGSEDKSIRVWDLRSGCCLRTLEGHREWEEKLSATLTQVHPG